VNDVPEPTQHRSIPILPARPRLHPTEHKIFRSYPTGRENFSRACQGKPLTLTVTMDDTIPSSIQVNLVTTLDVNGGGEWATVPFVRTAPCCMTCTVIPKHPGFHSFRAEFSLDDGATWRRDNVPDAWVFVDPESVDALRLYSLVPTVSGTTTDWKAELRRIRDMGFNAVHLLPITTLDTSESPYSARDLFSIDACYIPEGKNHGGLSQLEDFIEAAIELDMHLCFDLVLNHIGVHSNMANQAPDWIVPDEKRPDGLKRAGYWSEKGFLPWEDLVLINYEHPSEMIRSEIWSYMTDYALFWAKYANDTSGFVRFDNLHSSNADFAQAITTALHTEYPELGFLAEYFTDERTLLRTTPEWRLNLILATPWNYRFVPQLRDYLNYIHLHAEQVRYLMPITSHDSGAPAEEFGSPESTVPRYVAAALLGTGATGIAQGVEYGEAKRIEFIGRHPKMHFPEEARFADFLARVNAILAEHPTFQHGGNCEFFDNRHDAIIAAFRQDPSEDSIGFLIVCNFDIYNEQRIHLDLTKVLGPDGSFLCVELLSKQTWDIASAKLELLMPPCSAHVLKFDRSG